jgi:Mce-associated membrane protein
MNAIFKARRLNIAASVVLLAIVGWLGHGFLQHRRDDDRRGLALQVARQQVLDLTTLDKSNVNAKLHAMGARTTGDFARQLQGMSKSFASAVDTSKLTAKGTIDAAAVSSYTPKAASILVATTARVRNAQQPKATQRSYRMRVHLTWTDGKWLIDAMEFVT